MSASGKSTWVPFDPTLVSLLSRHAAACGIERLVVRQADLAMEMTLAAPSAAVGDISTDLKADCVGVLHWHHPDRPQEQAEGAVTVRAGEPFAYLEAGGLILPQTAPAGGRGERLVPAGTLVGYGTVLMVLQTA